MDPEAMKKLRLDLRLQTRRGWIDPAELEQELAALPDVSDKIDESEEGGGARTGSTEG